MNNLFSPLDIGDLHLNNRIIMAPLTRCRAGAGRAPTELMATYYAQRATAGLIISEATSISPMGVGYPDTPGIWSEEQIEGWTNVVKKVHAANGKIFLQLWHVGRLSDPIFLDGKQPVSASAIAAIGHPSQVRPIKNYDTPRELTIEEIKQIVLDYKQAAINAAKAGFDGVEIHGANGYLLDQFLQDNSNKRTDLYGGSIENRARLMLEVTDAICQVWSPNRVGMHLAPRCDAQSMGDSNPLATFSYIVSELAKRKIGFICARAKLETDNLHTTLKKLFNGVYIINQQLDFTQANNEIISGRADAAAWGIPYIANPDLVERFKKGAELNPVKPELFYGGDGAGYTDYPFLE